MDKVYHEIIVRGRVQGVNFRASTRKVAQELGITGQVKNLPDGSVAIVAAGTADAMNKFIEWCRQGPPMAAVTALEISNGPAKVFEGFQVVHA